MKKILGRLRVWLSAVIYGALNRQGLKQEETVIDNFYGTSTRMYIIRRAWYIHSYFVGLIPRWNYRIVASNPLRNFLLDSVKSIWNFIPEKLYGRVCDVSPDLVMSLSSMVKGVLSANQARLAELMHQELARWYQNMVRPVVLTEERRAREEMLNALKSDGLVLLEEACRTHFDLIAERLQAYIHREFGVGTQVQQIPPNTLFLIRNGFYSIYVVQQFPAKRTVTFKGHGTFSLQFPFVVFFVAFYKNQFRSVRVFFRQNIMKSMDDELCEAALPDIWESGKVCGPMPAEVLSPAEAVDASISLFWSSTFENPITHQLNHNYTRLAHKDVRFKNPASWDRAGQDPHFLKTVQWMRTIHTPIGVCNSMVMEKSKTEPATLMTGSISAFVKSEFHSVVRNFGDEILRFFLLKYPQWSPDKGVLEKIQNSAEALFQQLTERLSIQSEVMLRESSDIGNIQEALRSDFKECLDEIWKKYLTSIDDEKLETMIMSCMDTQLLPLDLSNTETGSVLEKGGLQ